MQLSEQLSNLSVRAKELEDRAAAAKAKRQPNSDPEPMRGA